ncbi:MAG: protein phosphatase 2C domain-containing protein [Bacteroidales bacterium]|jgi:protein phosphatase|nr:protein phosphatase 2C domain-containing protein [Bacteroidales bacterium]
MLWGVSCGYVPYESYEDEIISSNIKITNAENNIRDGRLNDALENLSEVPQLVLEVNEAWYKDYYTDQIKDISSEYKDSNNTIITELGKAKYKNLGEMIAILDSILLRKEDMQQLDGFQEKVSTLSSNIRSSYLEYDIVYKIQEDCKKVSDLSNKLKIIEAKITPASIENPEIILTIVKDYTIAQDNTNYISIFQGDENSWVRKRVSFFNDLYDMSLDMETVSSSEVGNYDAVLYDLQSLEQKVSDLKLEPDTEAFVRESLNTKKAYVAELKGNQGKLKYIYVLILFISSIVAIFALVYIFFFTSKKKEKQGNGDVSKLLEGRTLLIFDSRKFGNSAHPKNIEIYAESDVGLKRELNEDSIGITFNREGSKGLFVLADGMGGHNAGEVASKLAIQTVLEDGKNELFGYQELNGSDIKDILRNIVYNAHEEILCVSKSNPSMCNMGTTLEVVFLNKDHVYYAHVGDSRIYTTYTDGDCEERISKETTDHSELGAYMERCGATEAEARKNVPSNVITQAVGVTSAPLNPDIGDFPISKNNWILICSDGLSDMIQDDSYIGKILINNRLDVVSKVKELIQAAKDMGGKDNISLILFRRR